MICDSYLRRCRPSSRLSDFVRQATRIAAFAVLVVFASQCSALRADGFSSIRFLWAGTPPAVNISLHYSGYPDLPMASLSPWRMTEEFQFLAGQRWAVAIGDQPPLELTLDRPAGSPSAGEVLALVWLDNDAARTRLITLPADGATGRICILNLTGQPLITRVGDWDGSVSALAAHCMPPATGRSGEVVLAFAVRHNGRLHPVFSASLTVYPADRLLIVAGPANPHTPVPRRLPVRRICLRTSL